MTSTSISGILIALCCTVGFASCSFILDHTLGAALTSVYAADGRDHARMTKGFRLQETDSEAAAYCRAVGFKSMLLKYGMADTSFTRYSTTKQENLFEINRSHPGDRLEFFPGNGYAAKDNIQYTTGTYLLTSNEGKTRSGQYISYWASVHDTPIHYSKKAQRFLLIYNPGK